MALQMAVNDPDGTVHGVSYIILQSVFIDYIEGIVTVALMYYANKGAYETGKQSTKQEQVVIPFDAALSADVGTEAIAQILLLPEFSGAIEVP